MSEAGKGDLPGESPLPPTPPGASPVGPPDIESTISLEDVRKISLRIGVVVSAYDHPQADRLLVLVVDLGERSPRQLVAGIKGSYQAAELVGRQVVVVANLRPATLRGVESQGMVLAASDGSTIVLLSPERPVRAGSHVK